MMATAIYKRPEVIEPEFADARGVARLLGLSVASIARLTKSGKLPSVKIGQRRLYRLEAIREFMTSLEA